MNDMKPPENLGEIEKGLTQGELKEFNRIALNVGYPAAIAWRQGERISETEEPSPATKAILAPTLSSSPVPEAERQALWQRIDPYHDKGFTEIDIERVWRNEQENAARLLGEREALPGQGDPSRPSFIHASGDRMEQAGETSEGKPIWVNVSQPFPKPLKEMVSEATGLAEAKQALQPPIPTQTRGGAPGEAVSRATEGGASQDTS